MIPRIEVISEKKLVGNRKVLSLIDYKIGELWGGFMPRRNEISNRVTENLFSVAIYKPNYFLDFNPENEFERWATYEVTDFNHIPKGMETLIVPSGSYAVFHYVGSSSDSSQFYQHIFSIWLPNSDYLLDNRPHFEILGEKYRNNDPTSEEDIWIPIKEK